MVKNTFSMDKWHGINIQEFAGPINITLRLAGAAQLQKPVWCRTLRQLIVASLQTLSFLAACKSESKGLKFNVFLNRMHSSSAFRHP